MKKTKKINITECLLCENSNQAVILSYAKKWGNMIPLFVMTMHKMLAMLKTKYSKNYKMMICSQTHHACDLYCGLLAKKKSDFVNAIHYSKKKKKN